MREWSKQQALERKQKPNFTGRLKSNATILFILEEAKQSILSFS